MKKFKNKQILRQRKLFVVELRRNIKLINSERSYKLWAKNNCRACIVLPRYISLYDPKIRGGLLKSLRKIPDFFPTEKPISLDFRNVKKLDAVSTNYFVHQLHKHSYIPMVGRVSKNNTVRSMLTKLMVHKSLGMKEYYCNQQKVNKWLMARGATSDLVDGYEVIESALLDKFGETESFYIINEAISEAVNNVIDHAYDGSDMHKEWLIFLAIENGECNVVISDLGKTIPVSLPEKFRDSLKVGASNLFNFLRDNGFHNWKQINDADRIKLASIYRRTETNDKHRGKGFGNMMEVCKQVPNAELYVYSRNGVWMMKHGCRDQLKSFKTPVKGTIIYWSIPIGKSLSDNIQKKLAA